MSMDLETRIRIAVENSEAVENIGDLKKSLKDLKSLAVEAGAAGSASLDKIKAAGGELSDKMADINQSFKSFGSDTKKLDTVVQGIQGISAGFQIAQGASALFGKNNEELEKTLVKLNATMAIASGLQQAANLLQRETALGTALMTASQTAYNVAVGTSTGLLKLLRIALISTGVGALVVGVGMLIANFNEVKKTLSNLFPSLEKIGAFFKAMFQDFTDFIGVTSDATRAMDKMTDAADKSLSRNKKFMDEHGDQIDEFTKRKIDAVDRYNEAIKKDGANLIELNKRLNREIAAIDKERADEAEKNRKSEAAKAAAEAKKVYDEMLKLLGKHLNDRQLLLDRELIEREIQIYKDYADGTIKTQEELDKKLQDSGSIHTTRMISLLNEERIEVEKNTKLSAVDKLRLIDELNNKILQKERQLNKDIAQEKAEQRKKELEKLNQEAQDEYDEAIAEQKRKQDDIDKEKLEKAQKVKDALTSIGNISDANKGIDTFGQNLLNTLSKVSENAVLIKKQFEDLTNPNISPEDKAKAGLAMASTAASEIGSLMASQSRDEIANIQNETNEKLNALEIQKNAGLVTDQEYQNQKAEIQANAAKKELDAKKKAFVIDKAMRISQAVMGTAQAIITALSGGPIIGPILAGIAGAVGAAQIGVIAAQSFNGGGGGGSTNVSAPTGGGGQAAPQPSSFFGLGKSNLNAGGGKGDSQRVYVVESDITNTQGRMAKIKERSTLGG